LDDLRIYQSNTIREIAAGIRNDLAAGIFNQDQLSAALLDFILRDEQGNYWALAPRSQQWYRHGADGWSTVASAPSSFEGLSSLRAWPSSEAPSGPPEIAKSEGKSASSATDFMEQMFDNVQQSYKQGHITSVAAKALLSDIFLMDKQNRFWTLGFHSKNWYFFETERWHQAGAAPDPNELMDTVSSAYQEQVDQMAINFLVAMAGNPPEPIAAEWGPPGTFPEPVLQCPNCSRVDVGHHTQCKFCNSEIPQAVPTPEKLTKFCTQCGHEQPRRMKFCIQCGAKF
jgi:hypothetical protein